MLLTPSCPICLKTETRAFVNKNDFAVFACNYCRCGFVAPTPSIDELNSIYQESYFKRGNKYAEVVQTSVNVNASNETDRVTKLLKICSPKSVLDIGCGTGSFLKALADVNVPGIGVEPAEYAREFAKRHMGQSVFRSLAEIPSSFDAATLWDVIEHLPAPSEVIAEVSRRLTTGGILLISTGDFGSVLARILRRRWHLLTPPQHLFFFSKKGIRLLLDQNGFDVLSICHPGKYCSLEFALFKAREITPGLAVLASKLAKQFGVTEKRLYINLFDTMCVVARKK